MGSFGQGSFGEMQIGASAPVGAPYPVFVRNLDRISAVEPSIELAADHVHDIYEFVYFEVQLTDSDGILHTYTQTFPYYDQYFQSIFSTPYTSTVSADAGASIWIKPPVAFAPGKRTTIRVRATVDPQAEQTPGTDRWWTPWYEFPFTPVLDAWGGAVTDVVLWESKDKDVFVPESGRCHSSTPFLEWACGPADYFLWNLTLDRHNYALPYRTHEHNVDFRRYALYNGVWYIKLAPVMANVVGQVYEYKFTVEGADILA